MENKNLSIYELIKSSIQSDGSLPKDFSLPQEETDGISWADGAMDGVFLYHTARNEDSIEPLKDIIFQISEGKFEEADNNLNNLNFSMVSIKIPLLKWIFQEREKININNLYKFALFQLITAKNKECIKFSLSVLSLMGVENNAEIMEKIKILALSDEFTIYCLNIIEYSENANDEIFEIVERKKALFRPNNKLQEKIGRVVVMADAAHSLGAEYKGKPSGSVADFTCFSFHAVKNFTVAEGGSVTWNRALGLDDDEIYREFQLLSLHGQSKDALSKTQLGSWEYDIVAPNFKCNLTDIASGIGLAQLKRYPDLLKRRFEIVERYNKGFEGTRVKPFVHFEEDKKSCCHLYIVNIEGASEEERNEIIVKMAEKGIATNVHYKPLPMHTAYKNLGFDIKDYPNAFDNYKSEITLPLHTLLTDEQVDYIIENLKALV